MGTTVRNNLSRSQVRASFHESLAIPFSPVLLFFLLLTSWTGTIACFKPTPLLGLVLVNDSLEDNFHNSTIFVLLVISKACWFVAIYCVNMYKYYFFLQMKLLKNWKYYLLYLYGRISLSCIKIANDPTPNNNIMFCMQPLILAI